MPAVADLLRQRVHPLITSNRTLVYGFVSTLAVSIAIANALKNHSNFYSVAVYLSKSSRSLLVRVSVQVAPHNFLNMFTIGLGELRLHARVVEWTDITADILWTFTSRGSRGTSRDHVPSTRSDLYAKRLYDRIWFFVTESLLAFTIFRDDFDVPFAVMFGFLLFVKCFHWLLADRIEIVSAAALNTFA